MNAALKTILSCTTLCLALCLAACTTPHVGGTGYAGGSEAWSASSSTRSQEADAGTAESASSQEPDSTTGKPEEASEDAQGYVQDNPPAREAAAPLIVDTDPALYSYEDLENDVEALASRYPEWVHVDALGTTEDGRSLLHLVIGNPSADNQVLVHAGIHAREYITTQLVMKQASSFLSHASAGDIYDGVSYRDMLQASAIHVVPSVNPDGMAISQRGLEGIRNAAVRDRLLEIAALDGNEGSASYFMNWKANANGVDLNRNFDALWSSYAGSGHPSSERYKGTEPGSETEAAALIELTERHRFARTVSYHAYGSVIYWYFGQSGELYQSSEQLAQSIANLTGYRLDANFESLDPAGYKDWAIQALGIPSLTIEVGMGGAPVPPEEFATIWLQNEHVWEALVS